MNIERTHLMDLRRAAMDDIARLYPTMAEAASTDWPTMQELRARQARARVAVTAAWNIVMAAQTSIIIDNQRSQEL